MGSCQSKKAFKAALKKRRMDLKKHKGISLSSGGSRQPGSQSPSPSTLPSPSHLGLKASKTPEAPRPKRALKAPLRETPGRRNIGRLHSTQQVSSTCSGHSVHRHSTVSPAATPKHLSKSKSSKGGESSLPLPRFGFHPHHPNPPPLQSSGESTDSINSILSDALTGSEVNSACFDSIIQDDEVGYHEEGDGRENLNSPISQASSGVTAAGLNGGRIKTQTRHLPRPQVVQLNSEDITSTPEVKHTVACSDTGNGSKIQDLLLHKEPTTNNKKTNINESELPVREDQQLFFASLKASSKLTGPSKPHKDNNTRSLSPSIMRRDRSTSSTHGKGRSNLLAGGSRITKLQHSSNKSIAATLDSGLGSSTESDKLKLGEALNGVVNTNKIDSLQKKLINNVDNGNTSGKENVGIMDNKTKNNNNNDYEIRFKETNYYQLKNGNYLPPQQTLLETKDALKSSSKERRENGITYGMARQKFAPYNRNRFGYQNSSATQATKTTSSPLSNISSMAIKSKPPTNSPLKNFPKSGLVRNRIAQLERTPSNKAQPESVLSRTCPPKFAARPTPIIPTPTTFGKTPIVGNSSASDATVELSKPVYRRLEYNEGKGSLSEGPKKGQKLGRERNIVKPTRLKSQDYLIVESVERKRERRSNVLKDSKKGSLSDPSRESSLTNSPSESEAKTISDLNENEKLFIHEVNDEVVKGLPMVDNNKKIIFDGHTSSDVTTTCLSTTSKATNLISPESDASFEVISSSNQSPSDIPEEKGNDKFTANIFQKENNLTKYRDGKLLELSSCGKDQTNYDGNLMTTEDRIATQQKQQQQSHNTNIRSMISSIDSNNSDSLGLNKRLLLASCGSSSDGGGGLGHPFSSTCPPSGKSTPPIGCGGSTKGDLDQDFLIDDEIADQPGLTFDDDSLSASFFGDEDLFGEEDVSSSVAAFGPSGAHSMGAVSMETSPAHTTKTAILEKTTSTSIQDSSSKTDPNFSVFKTSSVRSSGRPMSSPASVEDSPAHGGTSNREFNQVLSETCSVAGDDLMLDYDTDTQQMCNGKTHTRDSVSNNLIDSVANNANSAANNANSVANTTRANGNNGEVDVTQRKCLLSGRRFSGEVCSPNASDILSEWNEILNLSQQEKQKDDDVCVARDGSPQINLPCSLPPPLEDSQGLPSYHLQPQAPLKGPGDDSIRQKQHMFKPPRQSSIANECHEAGGSPTPNSPTPCSPIDRTSLHYLCQDVTSMKTLLLRLRRLLQTADTINPFENSAQSGMYLSLACEEGPVGEARKEEEAQNVDLKRQVVLLQQQLQERDRKIRLLQQQLSQTLHQPQRPSPHFQSPHNGGSVEINSSLVTSNDILIGTPTPTPTSTSNYSSTSTPPSFTHSSIPPRPPTTNSATQTERLSPLRAANFSLATNAIEDGLGPTVSSEKIRSLSEKTSICIQSRKPSLGGHVASHRPLIEAPKIPIKQRTSHIAILPRPKGKITSPINVGGFSPLPRVESFSPSKGGNFNSPSLTNHYPLQPLSTSAP